jgi:hypothetical protein
MNTAPRRPPPPFPRRRCPLRPPAMPVLYRSNNQVPLTHRNASLFLITFTATRAPVVVSTADTTCPKEPW